MRLNGVNLYLRHRASEAYSFTKTAKAPMLYQWSYPASVNWCGRQNTPPVNLKLVWSCDPAKQPLAIAKTIANQNSNYLSSYYHLNPKQINKGGNFEDQIWPLMCHIIQGCCKLTISVMISLVIWGMQLCYSRVPVVLLQIGIAWL